MEVKARLTWHQTGTHRASAPATFPESILCWWLVPPFPHPQQALGQALETEIQWGGVLGKGCLAVPPPPRLTCSP